MLRKYANRALLPVPSYDASGNLPSRDGRINLRFLAGKIFAMLSVCDNAVPLFSGSLYSQLYNATINTAPNSFYWLTFSTQIAVLLLIM